LTEAERKKNPPAQQDFLARGNRMELPARFWFGREPNYVTLAEINFCEPA
jgi:hypothetical protein